MMPDRALCCGASETMSRPHHLRTDHMPRRCGAGAWNRVLPHVLTLDRIRCRRSASGEILCWRDRLLRGRCSCSSGSPDPGFGFQVIGREVRRRVVERRARSASAVRASTKAAHTYWGVADASAAAAFAPASSIRSSA